MQLQLVGCGNISSRSWEAAADCGTGNLDVTTQRSFMRPDEKNCLIYATVAGGWLGLADGLTACILLALPYVYLFLFAGGGAGDAKLMAALGGWLGVVNGLIALASVALTGVVMAIVWAITRRSVPAVLSNVKLIVSGTLAGWYRGGALGDSDGEVARPGGLHTMPYGVAIFIGVCTAAAGVLVWRLSTHEG